VIRRRHLGKDAGGIAAVEFALALPVLLGLIVGATQLGMLYFANADLRNAVAAGARLASIYPRPDDAAVIAQINARVTRLDSHFVVGPTVARGSISGRAYADIEMRYAVPLDFIIFRTPPVTLVETRRVFTQPEAS
jgi:Flp pilus assembly protein TadG